jgi:hypothetical protein
MVNKGYDLQFKNDKCKIISGFRSMIASGKKTKGNIFHLNVGAKSCLIAQVDEIWLWHRRLYHVNFVFRSKNKNPCLVLFNLTQFFFHCFKSMLIFTSFIYILRLNLRNQTILFCNYSSSLNTFHFITYNIIFKMI